MTHPAPWIGTQRVRAAIAALAAFGLLAAGCSGAGDRTSSAAPRTDTPILDRGDWVPEIHSRLVSLVTENADQGKIAVFDWDNTSQCRDVGAATFAQLVSDGAVTWERVPAAISPSFVVDGTTYSHGTSDILEYKENAADATAHQGDPTSDYFQVTWETEAMAGLTVAQVLDNVSKAYDGGAAEADRHTSTTTTVAGTDVLRPYVYPEMADLYGFLLANGFEVYVISASNVWALRWLVKNVMNPMIQAKYGPDVALEPDHLIGIRTYLQDTVGDDLLAEGVLAASDTPEGRAYADLDPAATAQYQVTGAVSPPVSDFVGKPANVIEHITGDVPFLVAGDSNGDYQDLTRAQHRLWITRVEQPEYQTGIVDTIDRAPEGEWLLQPTLVSYSSGFVASQTELDKRLERAPDSLTSTVQESLRTLDPTGLLEDFGN